MLNVCSTSASDAGIIAAAPSAWMIRAPIRNSTDGAIPHNIEAKVKMTTALRNSRRRPIRSASRPAGISAAANTIVYAFSTHDRAAVLVPLKVRLIEGKATYKMVVSRKTAKTEQPVAMSTIHWLLAARCFIGRPS